MAACRMQRSVDVSMARDGYSGFSSSAFEK